MFDSLLVASRGDSAFRIIKTAKRMGVHTIAIYTDADADLPYVAKAHEAIRIPSASDDPYLNVAAIVDAARRTNARAIHPGDGPLALDVDFAQRVIDEGMAWVGPKPKTMRQLADRDELRESLAQAGVLVTDGEDAAAGRHQVEVQVLGLADGCTVAISGRDCCSKDSYQDGTTSGDLCQAICDATARVGKALKFRSAGTFRFLVEDSTGTLYFQQVDPVVPIESLESLPDSKIDSVEQQLLIAAGQSPSFEPKQLAELELVNSG